MVTRLTVVADREAENLESIISHCNNHPDDISLAAIIVPFVDLDYDLGRTLRFLGHSGWASDLGRINLPSPFAIEGFEHPFQELADLNVVYKYFQGSERKSTLVLHAPYTKGMDGATRFVYSEALTQFLNFTEPDLVLFANYKAFLDGVVPNTFPFKVLNIHPSILPENRGWRPELKVLKGINPDSSGYTFHVLTEKLDEGPTLFQQHVPHVGHDEESLRLAIITAQKRWTPRVLSLYASERKSVVVQGREAFRAEGRESHYDCSEIHDGYSRILFEHNGRFRTAEEILGSERTVPSCDINRIRVYSFSIQGPNPDVFIQVVELLGRVGDKHRPHIEHTINYSDGSARCSVRSKMDLSDFFRKEGISIEETIDFPVSVTAPRINFK